MNKCYLDGYLGKFDAKMYAPKDVFTPYKVVSDCGKVSIQVNQFIAKDRLDCDDCPTFYYS
jgi:hypothetical protein